MGKSVVKFIFFHLYNFLNPSRGNPKSDPIELALTKYTWPSAHDLKNLRKLTLWLYVDVLRVLLLIHLLHVKDIGVGVQVVEHVCILVAA